jgi:hypothetical protein
MSVYLDFFDAMALLGTFALDTDDCFSPNNLVMPDDVTLVVSDFGS